MSPPDPFDTPVPLPPNRAKHAGSPTVEAAVAEGNRASPGTVFDNPSAGQAVLGI